VDRPGEAPLALEGHAGEVTGVAWCPTDLGQITTCHDDATVNVWALDRSRERRASGLGRAAALPAAVRTLFLFLLWAAPLRCSASPLPSVRSSLAVLALSSSCCLPPCSFLP
jgi:hypothetical protein